MSQLVLHVDMLSQPARTVYWLALLLNAPVQVRTLRLSKGETKTPEFLRLHPQGKVPVLELPDKRPLIESSAQLLYLCRNFGGVGRFFPSDELDAARTLSYLFWHPELRTGCAGWFITNALAPNPPTPDKAERSEKALQTALDVFEKYWLKDGPYIAGLKSPTIADMQAYNELSQITPFHATLLTSRPAVGAWFGKVRSLPKHDEMYAAFAKVSEVLKQKKSKL